MVWYPDSLDPVSEPWPQISDVLSSADQLSAWIAQSSHRNNYVTHEGMIFAVIQVDKDNIPLTNVSLQESEQSQAVCNYIQGGT